MESNIIPQGKSVLHLRTSDSLETGVAGQKKTDNSTQTQHRGLRGKFRDQEAASPDLSLQALGTGHWHLRCHPSPPRSRLFAVWETQRVEASGGLG